MIRRWLPFVIGIVVIVIVAAVLVASRAAQPAAPAQATAPAMQAPAPTPTAAPATQAPTPTLTAVPATQALTPTQTTAPTAQSPAPTEAATPALETATPGAETPGKVNMDEIFPPGTEKERNMVFENCTACHTFLCFVRGQRTAAQWATSKLSHRPKVIALSDADFDLLYKYLEENFNDTKPEPKIPQWLLEQDRGCTGQ
jgi:hypothetical protein